jgi:F0F1-type ATP synthase membrane subunit b/b'
MCPSRRRGARDQLADEKKKLEQEIQAQRETGLRDLTEREKVLAVKEAEAAALQSQPYGSPARLRSASYGEALHS